MEMRKYLRLAVAVILLAGGVAAGADTPLLLQQPTISKTEVAFVCGGYVWSVSRSGGEARQLTTGGHESHPSFSPDGKWIFFFQAEDGIRDLTVTGVQTCALPISGTGGCGPISRASSGTRSTTSR